MCPSPSDTRPEFSALPQAASASGPVGAEAASDAGIGAGKDHVSLCVYSFSCFNCAAAAAAVIAAETVE